jgi:hypothetical protein
MPLSASNLFRDRTLLRHCEKAEPMKESSMPAIVPLLRFWIASRFATLVVAVTL